MMTGDDDEADFVMGDMTQRILQSLIDESIHFAIYIATAFYS